MMRKKTDEIVESMGEFNDIFMESQDAFIASRLNYLLEELEGTDGVDVIDDLVKEQISLEMNKICNTCNVTAPIQSRICRLC